MVRGVRGATTVEQNTEQEIIQVTEELLQEMINKNKLIWVVGNHEFLILKRLEEQVFNRHNDTYKTLLELAKESSGKFL